MLIKIPLIGQIVARGQGVPYPPFDPSRDEKNWVDPNPPAADANGNVTYQVVNNAGTGFEDLVMTRAHAESPNLFGHDDYPAAPPQLVATFNNGNSSVPVCDLATAQALAKEMGVDPSSIVDAMASILPSLQLKYPDADPSARPWQFSVAGVPVQVCFLLSLKNANGVGAPGHWNGAVWVSDLPAPDVTSPAMPQPVDMSKVPAGAQVQESIMDGGIPELFVPDAPVSTSTGGSFDPSTDPTIQHLMRKIDALLTADRVTIPA